MNVNSPFADNGVDCLKNINYDLINDDYWRQSFLMIGIKICKKSIFVLK